MPKLKAYMLWLDKCDFPSNIAGAKCTRCGQELDKPLKEGTFFSCAKGRQVIGGYVFWCPGCDQPHPYRVHPDPYRANMPMWSFNGDMDRPTFSPSLLVHPSPGQPRCHLFVKNGTIEFCGDCDHALAGKTVPMIEIPKDRW